MRYSRRVGAILCIFPDLLNELVQKAWKLTGHEVILFTQRITTMPGRKPETVLYCKVETDEHLIESTMELFKASVRDLCPDIDIS